MADSSGSADDDANKLLLEYAQLGKPGLAQIVLARGASLHAVDDMRRNVLHLAALFGRSEFMKWALEQKTLSVDAPDVNGITPLVNACASSNAGESIVCMRLLLDAGAEAGLANPNGGGTTPLMQAAGFDNLQGVALLLERGAPVDARDKDGSTALMYAAHCDSALSIAALTQAGANPLLKDKHGKTALDQARERCIEAVPVLELYEEEWRRAQRDKSNAIIDRQAHGGIAAPVRAMKPLALKAPGGAPG